MPSRIIVSAEFVQAQHSGVRGQLHIPLFADWIWKPRGATINITAHSLAAPTNPKVGFTWQLSEEIGATIRGGWGTSFRFANAGEYSEVASNAVGDFTYPLQSAPSRSHADPAGLRPPAHWQPSSSLPVSGANSTPGGISWGGAPHPPIRSFTALSTGLVTSREGGDQLAPETSTTGA